MKSALNQKLEVGVNFSFKGVHSTIEKSKTKANTCSWYRDDKIKKMSGQCK